MVVLVIIAGVVLIIGLPQSVKTQQANTAAATFSYPESWIHQDVSNIIKIKPDGSSPAIDYVAKDTDSNGEHQTILIYQATDKPEATLPKTKLEYGSRLRLTRAAIDKGIAGQLAALQEQLVYIRGTAALGFVANAEYAKPAQSPGAG